MRPRIAWYTQWVLPPSETFVAHQLSAMKDVDAALFGVDVVPGIEVTGRTFVLERDCVLGAVEGLLWKALRWAPRLCSAIRDFGPQVLIAHHLQNAWRVAQLAEKIQIPLAAMCHGSDLLAMRDAQQSRGVRQTAANWLRLVETTQLFLPVSQFLADRLMDSGVPPSRIAVHYLGVPIPDSAGLGRAAERSGVLFVGRLSENKGCHLLLQAVGKLAQRRRIQVTIVGDGPQRAALHRQAAALPPGARVRFTGSLPNQQVDRLMREHRVVCVPSVEVASGASEGLGLVACEGAAHGRPVIAFDTGGLRETVVHQETGLVVPQRDVHALAQALEAVLTDDHSADAMGLAGRRLAEDRFNLPRQSHGLRVLLAERGLLATRP